MARRTASVQNDGEHQLITEDKNMQSDESAVTGGDEQNGENGDGNCEDLKSGVGDQDPDDSEGAEDDAEDDAGDGSVKTLTAVYPILYLSHQYRIGEELPANDPEMVKAWVDAGTAVWTSATKPDVKAKPRTAESGLFGQAAVSVSENGDNLVGKVPETGTRER